MNEVDRVEFDRLGEQIKQIENNILIAEEVREGYRSLADGQSELLTSYRQEIQRLDIGMKAIEKRDWLVDPRKIIPNQDPDKALSCQYRRNAESHWINGGKLLGYSPASGQPYKIQHLPNSKWVTHIRVNQDEYVEYMKRAIQIIAEDLKGLEE